MGTGVLLAFILAFGSVVPVTHGSSIAQEISGVFNEEFQELWGRGDAKGLGSLWTSDGEWMSLTGSRRIVRGQEAIAGVWEVGLEGREDPDQLALEIEVTQVIVLSPELAQVDLLMIFGSQRTGLMKEAMVAILVREAESWKIQSARVARIPE